MTRCDCGAFESCDVCIAIAERDLGPYTAEDYARHCRIGVDPATGNDESESTVIVSRIDEDGNVDEIYSELCLQLVHERAHGKLTGVSHPEFGGWAGRGGFHRW